MGYQILAMALHYEVTNVRVILSLDGPVDSDSIVKVSIPWFPLLIFPSLFS